MLKLLGILFALYPAICMAQDKNNLSNEDIAGIVEFIDAIKTDDAKQISKLVKYPLNRFNPVPDIKDDADFIEKYDILFDENLKKLIINSDVQKDWRHVGWRGYMLYWGQLWLDPNTQHLIAINYVSDKEKEYGQKLLQESLEQIHPSLRTFKKPVLCFETDKFIIRVDKIDEKDSKTLYRYASWNKNKTPLDEPDLVLYNGIQHFSGNGGNHEYLFKNDNYLYEVGVNVVGPIDMSEMDLIIYKFKQPVQDLTKVADELYKYEDEILLYTPSTKVIMNE